MLVVELSNWVGVPPTRGVAVKVCWGVCWTLLMEGTGVKLAELELLETRLDSLELEVWQEAEVGVAKVTQG